MPLPYPEPGYYYNYKHRLTDAHDAYAYEVLGVSLDSEDKGEAVIYRPLYKEGVALLGAAKFFSRSLRNFLSPKKSRATGRIGPRFQRIKNQEVIEILDHFRKQFYGVGR